MMDLTETNEERSFRAEVRGWLTDSIPDRLRGSKDFADRLEADRILATKGYLGFTWPREFGGEDASPAFASILDEERAAIGIPTSASPSRFGTSLLGPTLIRHGSTEQQQELLPPILRADQIWCQGFSEPEAGSDLANVQCTASERGENLVIEGSKIWTTQAQESDWCFALVNCDPGGPRHRNLAFVLIPMDRPGIEVQPLVQLTGEAEFTQVFFSGVEVERRYLVGALGEGWKVAMTTLSAERTYSQLSRFAQYVAQLRRVAAMLAEADEPTRSRFAYDLGRVAARLTGIRNMSLKIGSMATASEDVGTLASTTKLWWSTTHQELVELGWKVAAQLGEQEDYWYPLWLQSRGETIYAGASQIQRNIISERGLGLPR